MAVAATGINYIDSLIKYNSWTGNAGQAGNIAYNFTIGAGYGYGVPASMQAGFTAALQEWANVARVTFTQSFSTSETQRGIAFAIENLGPGTLGLTYSLDVSGSTIRQMLVELDDQFSSTSSIAKGTLGYFTLLHEIGHALGLEHPRAYAGTELSPHLPANEDTIQNTVMSYYNGAVVNEYANAPQGPMIYDIAAIQYLYGANYSYNAGNNYYGSSAASAVKTIWDGGGIDTLGAYGLNVASRIDLREGVDYYTQIGSWYNWNAFGANIEYAAGSLGNDTIYGNTLNNFIAGYEGSDLIYGNEGADSIMGGYGGDTIVGGTGNDFLSPDWGADLVYGQGGNDSIIAWSENDTVYGDTVTADASDGNDTISGNAGNDVLHGGGASDWLYGQDGNDSLLGGGGNDILIGDELEATNDTIYGDSISASGSDGSDTIYGYGGNDLMIDFGGDDILIGGAGNDTISGGAGTNQLLGEAGSDSITGGTDGEWLLGGNDDDYIAGNGGNDTLIGGTGNDTFYFAAGAGNDRITDFEGGGTVGGDTIRLAAFNLNGSTYIDLNDLVANIGYSGGNATINFGGQVITVVGIAPGTLAAGDFFVG